MYIACYRDVLSFVYLAVGHDPRICLSECLLYIMYTRIRRRTNDSHHQIELFTYIEREREAEAKPDCVDDSN